MANTTWLECYNEVSELLGVRNDATLVSRVSKIFNMVARKISRSHDWEFLKTDDTAAFTLTAGTREYNCPADFRKQISVYYDRADGGITELRDYTDLTEAKWRKRINVLTTAAYRKTPTGYRIKTWDDEDAEARVRKIEFDPTPDAVSPADVLGMIYFRFINELTTTTQVVAYPDDFIDLVREGTLDIGFRTLRQPILASMYKDDFDDGLKNMKNQIGTSRSRTPRMRTVYGMKRATRQRRWS